MNVSYGAKMCLACFVLSFAAGAASAMDWGGDAGSIVRSMQAARGEEERRKFGRRIPEPAVVQQTRAAVQAERPKVEKEPEAKPEAGEKQKADEQPKAVVRTIKI